jgi:hypothetical protein
VRGNLSPWHRRGWCLLVRHGLWGAPALARRMPPYSGSRRIGPRGCTKSGQVARAPHHGRYGGGRWLESKTSGTSLTRWSSNPHRARSIGPGPKDPLLEVLVEVGMKTDRIFPVLSRSVFYIFPSVSVFVRSRFRICGSRKWYFPSVSE